MSRVFWPHATSIRKLEACINMKIDDEIALCPYCTRKFQEIGSLVLHPISGALIKISKFILTGKKSQPELMS